MDQPRKIYVTTVQLAFAGCDSAAQAMDAVSEMFREHQYREYSCLLDWEYVKLGGQFLHPTERHIGGGEYEEGDAFR